jgi:uncharacterized protein YeaO (DUF488 family)
MIRCKRVYEPSERRDGYRVLVDRLWPRGLSRNKAAIDEWLKELAPSNDLRRWYGHRPDRWPEFQVRYRRELAAQEVVQELGRLRSLAASRNLTLLTATRSVSESHAAVLKSLLTKA